MKVAVAVALALCGTALAAAAAMLDVVAAALASPDRPEADTRRDVNRKPAALLAFAEIKPGEKVADVMPGGGYFTRIFSKVVGPGGKVYALVPSELLHVAPKMADAVQMLAASPVFANVTPLVAPTAASTTPQPVDVAWTSDNYHDLYGFFGPDEAARFDAAVFKLVRPGGEFIVIDHVAAAGAAATAPKGLHRIDPTVVKAQVIAAGFVFEGESTALRNPDDTHQLSVFDPSIRGRTDQFVYKFRKPAR